MEKNISVVVVDDSAFIRNILSEILNSEPGIEVIGTAVDPIDAREKIKKLNPDVITLDIEMPNMDGVSFLEKIMALRPMPVVMVSTLTKKGADITLECLEIGAVDFIAKPENAPEIISIKRELIAKVKAAAAAKLSKNSKAEIKKINIDYSVHSKKKVVAIGASTGGVEALTSLLKSIPEKSPPFLITQHMPKGFTKSFAERLDKLCSIKVYEAEDGQVIEPGSAYIAPGGKHFGVKKEGGRYLCSVFDGEIVSGHKPSVDVLFSDVADIYSDLAVGVILTGMGRDGTAGMVEMRNKGAYTIGQDEASSLVYGMPKSAFMAGAVDVQKPLSEIPLEIMNQFRS